MMMMMMRGIEFFVGELFGKMAHLLLGRNDRRAFQDRRRRMGRGSDCCFLFRRGGECFLFVVGGRRGCLLFALVFAAAFGSFGFGFHCSSLFRMFQIIHGGSLQGNRLAICLVLVFLLESLLFDFFGRRSG